MDATTIFPIKIQRSESKMLFITQLIRGQYQPRQHFDLDSLQELAETIKRVGILEPLLVRPSYLQDQYEIIAGERRWRAAQLAGLEKVPCIIGDYSDEQTAQIALIENIARKNLNPIEEAEGISKLIQEFNYTHEEAAGVLGKSRTEITNLLRLLKLDSRVRELILSADLTESHGKVLAGVPLSEQYFYAHETISKCWSIRALEKATKQILNDQISFLDKENNASDVQIQNLTRKLSDHLCLPVRFDFDNKTLKKGFVKIRFDSLDELDGILERVGYSE
jgi:ParB family chromosome partitioning protein